MNGKKSQARQQSVRRETRKRSKRGSQKERSVETAKGERSAKQTISETIETNLQHADTASQNQSSQQRQSPKPSERSHPVLQVNPDQVEQTGSELMHLVCQLEVWSRHPDLNVSRTAFDALAATLHDLLSWLWMSAILPEASLGALVHELSSEVAWERYKRGEHVAAWTGVELARLCKQIKAELGSRSKHSINRVRDLRFGLELGNAHFSPNQWFCDEYESKADYRPTGQMAVWAARKIEEVRLLKQLRLQWWPLGTVVPPQTEAETVLPAWRRLARMVKGEAALKQLDDLPPFGGSDADGFEAWRKFVRHQLLTQMDVVSEFRNLFPQEPRKLDGVLTTTLRCAWQAVSVGGIVLFPALSGHCK